MSPYQALTPIITPVALSSFISSALLSPRPLSGFPQSSLWFLVQVLYSAISPIPQSGSHSHHLSCCLVTLFLPLLPPPIISPIAPIAPFWFSLPLLPPSPFVISPIPPSRSLSYHITRSFIRFTLPSSLLFPCQVPSSVVFLCTITFSIMFPCLLALTLPIRYPILTSKCDDLLFYTRFFL